MDAGLYTCQVVENGGERDCTETYNLNVYYMESPNIKEYTTNIGNNVVGYTLCCQWSKMFPKMEPNVTWFQNGNTLEASTTYVLETQGNVHTMCISYISEVGDYSCRIDVETSMGNMSKTSNCKELQSPYVDSPIVIVSIDNTKRYYAFYCVWGLLYPEFEPDITWIFNGNILNTSITKYSVTDEGKRWNKLIILDTISKDDLGNYSCCITVQMDDGTNITKKSNVEELWQASISVTRLSVVEEERIAIPAGVGVPINEIVTIKWYKYKSPNTSYIIVSLTNRTNGRFSIDGTGENYGDLIIQHADREDAGYYTIQIFEKEDSRQQTITYYLDVHYLPQPTLTSFTEKAGHRNTLYCRWCQIYPEMEPYVAWLHNGHILNTSTTKYSVIKNEQKNRQTLIILEMTEQDVGEYACRALDSTVAACLSSTILIVAVVITFIFGSVPTCVIAICLHKVSMSQPIPQENPDPLAADERRQVKRLL
ncbi:fasciclin-2-like [Antedon mediterranea]|uniref:fasciclin-2-like n=1 Tax=Antedon mediterranea TaxID=105859 RepID=UPI003AF8D0B2